MNTQPTQVDINEAMEYAAALKHCHDCFADRAAIVLYDELTAVTEQRDRLDEVLRKIKNAGGIHNDPYDELDFIDGITYEALQSLTPNEP